MSKTTTGGGEFDAEVLVSTIAAISEDIQEVVAVLNVVRLTQVNIIAAITKANQRLDALVGDDE